MKTKETKMSVKNPQLKVTRYAPALKAGKTKLESEEKQTNKWKSKYENYNKILLLKDPRYAPGFKPGKTKLEREEEKRTKRSDEKYKKVQKKQQDS